MEIFLLNLEVSNLMMYESRDEEATAPAERRTERNEMREDLGKTPKLYGGN